jgi:hypothetical protein
MGGVKNTSETTGLHTRNESTSEMLEFKMGIAQVRPTSEHEEEGGEEEEEES